MPETSFKRHYLIELIHGDAQVVDRIELEAIGPEVALSRIEAIRDTRQATIHEDGRKIAKLTYLDGFWQLDP